MARTIKEIQQSLSAELHTGNRSLSDSDVAEWKLWTYIQATAIHTFELLHDAFRKEVEAAADKITPGTVRWYVEQCRRFQYGKNHVLQYDPQTAELYYETDDPDARIISVVAITENTGALNIKVAKLVDNKIVRLTEDELADFEGYIDSIKFAGIETYIISNDADTLRYDMRVFFDPAYPKSVVEDHVMAALDEFRTTLDFNSILYKQKLVDAVMHAEGVVTVELNSLERKPAASGEDQIPVYAPVGTWDELASGYFDYDETCKPELISIKAKNG